jgi:hypothetical protein
MKALSTVVLSLVLICGLYAEEIQSKADEEAKWGRLEGQLRLYHVFSPAYIKSGRATDNTIEGSTIGGHLRYHTPEFSGLGATAAVYYARGTGLNDKYHADSIMAAGRFFTSNYSPKAVLGEANIHYKDRTHHAIAGRYKVNTPITNAIFTYMPHMYQAFQYTNSALDSTKISLLQIEKMAYGNRSPVEFGLIGEVTRTGGVAQNGLDTRGDFIDIEEQTLGVSTVKTDGVTVLGIENASIPNTKLRLWDFYGHDIMNMFYLDATYSSKEASLPYSLAGQYLRIDSVGDALALKPGFMDSTSAYLVGLKGTIKYGKALFYLAYNHSGDSRVFNPWGGDPAYTSSFFSKNAYRANVDAYKLGFNYQLLENLKLISSHAEYSKSTTPGTFAPIKPTEPLSLPENDAFESAFLLSYNPFKKLNILGGVIYKTSEHNYLNEQVKILDVDLLVTYKF